MSNCHIVGGGRVRRVTTVRACPPQRCVQRMELTCTGELRPRQEDRPTETTTLVHPCIAYNHSNTPPHRLARTSRLDRYRRIAGEFTVRRFAGTDHHRTRLSTGAAGWWERACGYQCHREQGPCAVRRILSTVVAHKQPLNFKRCPESESQSANDKGAVRSRLRYSKGVSCLLLLSAMRRINITVRVHRPG